MEALELGDEEFEDDMEEEDDDHNHDHDHDHDMHEEQIEVN